VATAASADRTAHFLSIAVWHGRSRQNADPDLGMSAWFVSYMAPPADDTLVNRSVRRTRLRPDIEVLALGTDLPANSGILMPVKVELSDDQLVLAGSEARPRRTIMTGLTRIDLITADGYEPRLPLSLV